MISRSARPGHSRDNATVLPLAQGVALCRSLSLGTATTLDVAARAAYLLVFVVAGLAVARVTYRRRLHP